MSRPYAWYVGEDALADLDGTKNELATRHLRLGVKVFENQKFLKTRFERSQARRIV